MNEKKELSKKELKEKLVKIQTIFTNAIFLIKKEFDDLDEESKKEVKKDYNSIINISKDINQTLKEQIDNVHMRKQLYEEPNNSILSILDNIKENFKDIKM